MTLMAKTSSVKLDEFERAFTIKNYDDVVAMIRKLIDYELDLLSNVPNLSQHEEKIEAYALKIEPFKQTKEYANRVKRSEKALLLKNINFMWTVALTADGYIRFIHLVAMGNIHQLNIEPLYIFEPFFLEQPALRAIVVHTHMSDQQIEPSSADIKLTSELLAMSESTHIMLHDHIIISKTDAYSFCNSGLLAEIEQQRKIKVEENHARYRKFLEEEAAYFKAEPLKEEHQQEEPKYSRKKKIPSSYKSVLEEFEKKMAQKDS